ncbi:hypothetical protein JW916_15220, partial [Candidatus Sumerlaeota bacterium]|nr:hypothetical protein [Candidatus Sumerlaeota bacterium]
TEPQTQAPWEKCGDRHVGLDIAFSWKTQSRRGEEKTPIARSFFAALRPGVSEDLLPILRNDHRNEWNPLAKHRSQPGTSARAT